MPKWSVTLNGDPWDLKTLADLGVGVSEEGNGFVLCAPDLDTLTDAGAVRQRVIELVEVLNGLGRVTAHDFTPVVVGSVRDDDSGQTVMDLRGTVKMRSRARAELTVGEPMPQPTVFASRVAAAGRDPNVQQALRLFGGPATPANLYRCSRSSGRTLAGRRRSLARAGPARPR